MAALCPKPGERVTLGVDGAGRCWQRRRILRLLLTAPVAGCAGGTDTRWVGPVTPDAPNCHASRGVLVAHGDSFLFAPSEGVVVLRGSISADGTLHGRFESEGQDHQMVTFRFDGRLAGRQISGVLTQPGCRATVVLQPG